MRQPKEMDDARKLIVAVLSGNIPSDVDEKSRAALSWSAAAIEWALEMRDGEHASAANQLFERVLMGLRAAAAKNGYVPKTMFDPSDN